MRRHDLSHAGAVPRVLRIAFGAYSRYLFCQHLRHCLIVAVALLSLALTIDLIPQLPFLLIASESGRAKLIAVLFLLLVRAADLLPRFLPLAVFLGVLWTEATLTSSRERLLVWNAARTPAHFLAAVTAIAVIFGVAQFELDNVARPAAMSAQIHRHLGSLGQMYDRGLASRNMWFSARHDLVRANVQYAPVVLRDMTLYRFDDAWRLTEIDTAETAVPDKNRDAWRLINGETWAFDSKSGGAAAGGDHGLRLHNPVKHSFSGRTLIIALNPAWVGVWGIGPEYLSRDALTAVANLDRDAHTTSLFQTRIDLNWANATMPGGMAFLASVLTVFLLPYRVQFARLFGAGLVGYAAHLAIRIAVLFGENGILSPVTAAWLVPFLIYASAAGLLAILMFRIRMKFSDASRPDVAIRRTARRETILADGLPAVR